MHKINRNYIKLYILLDIPNIIIKFYPNIASSKTQRHSTLTQTFPDSPFMDMDDVMHTYNSKGYHGTGGACRLRGTKTFSRFCSFCVGKEVGEENRLNKTTTKLGTKQQRRRRQN